MSNTLPIALTGLSIDFSHKFSLKFFDPYAHYALCWFPLTLNPFSGSSSLFLMFVQEDEDDCHPLLKQITSEQWFPKNSPQTVDNVVNCFAAFMGNVDDSVHTAICSYIVQIHR